MHIAVSALAHWDAGLAVELFSGKLFAPITTSGTPPPSTSPMRTAWGIAAVEGQSPTPALPAHGGRPRGEVAVRPNPPLAAGTVDPVTGGSSAARAAISARSAGGMSMRLRTARVLPSRT